ncbi:unnamed protein product [Microthlaspi erraticum]|uniref:Uncharacterized protein n=1 Tax=Microthlaspi erraticum TaxID=1685480 RepID=A0A6D2JUH3_9BRAS|nr:unnamed protein product [Microthlaspi erraticum]
MDFIKTSSLRALIELTFQRNWNGIIWMSRKGVIAKRVKTVQTALSRNQPNAQTGWPRNECSALGQNIRPTEVSAKVKPLGRSHARPGKHARGRPSFKRHAKPRTTKRASRETSLAAAQPISRATADASVRAGKERPTSGRESSSAKFQSARPRRPTANPSAPTVPTRPRSDCPADRPARPSQRRGRPEALLKPKLMFSSPA